LSAGPAGLSAGRLSLSHDHDACDLVLGVKHEAVIQIGEDALQPFFHGQVHKGYGDFLLEKGFISPEPDAGLLLDISCHIQKGRLFEVYREQAVFDAHRLGTQPILVKEKPKNTRDNQADTKTWFD
jgi:hypothetical protein